MIYCIRKRGITLITILCFSCSLLLAQDYHFSAFYSVPSSWLYGPRQEEPGPMLDGGTESIWESRFLPRYSHETCLSVSLGYDYWLTHSWRFEADLQLSAYFSECLRFGQAGSQQVCYVGIPARLDYVLSLPSGKSEVYAGAGGQVEKGVYGYNGMDRLDADGWCWSLLGGVGVQFALQQGMSVYIEPTVVWTFQSPDTMSLEKNLVPYATCRYERPFQLALKIGLRKNFENTGK